MPPEPPALVRVIGGVGRQFRGDFGDVAGDFFDLLVAPGGRHVARYGLGGEHRGAQEIDFRLGAGPFAAVKRLHGELDEELIGRAGRVPRRRFRCAPTARE